MSTKIFNIALSLFLTLGVLSSCPKTGEIENQEIIKNSNPLMDLPVPKFTFKFGTKSHPGGIQVEGGDDCKCCVGEKGICVVIDIELKMIGDIVPVGQGLAEMDVIDSTHLFVGITEDTYQDSTSSSLKVEGDVLFTSTAATQLGYNSITIKPGTYTLDYTDPAYPYGKTIVDIESTK